VCELLDQAAAEHLTGLHVAAIRTLKQYALIDNSKVSRFTTHAPMTDNGRNFRTMYFCLDFTPLFNASTLML
jgi:hypothetical protein